MVCIIVCALSGPVSNMNHYNISLQYIDMELASEAISAFSKAISLDHYHVNAWTNLGLLYQDLSQ